MQLSSLSKHNMKNFLILCLLLAPTLITRAQLPEETQTSTLPAIVQLGIDPVISDSSLSDKPASAVALYVNVLDQKTNRPIDTDITIFYNSDFVASDSGRVENGEFTTDLTDFGWYFISLSTPGYFGTTDTVWVVSESRKRIEKKFYLFPMEVGGSITLSNIQFTFAKTSLSEASFAELDKEVLFLHENPTVIFEIAGHTDSDGPADFNLLLSQGRAQKVVDYMVSRGVESRQLIARGYGETRPMEGNKSHLAKANNRRVELTVSSTGIDQVEDFLNE